MFKDITFDAKAVLLERKSEGVWSEKEVRITSYDDIKNLVGFKTFTERVDIDEYHKLYFSVDHLIECGGLVAFATTGDRTHFMAAPILLVYCDGVKPIDITPDSLKKMRELVDLY